MGYLDRAGQFEGDIRRGALSVRSKRLDALVLAIDDYVKVPNRAKLENIEQKLDDWKKADPKEFADRGTRPEVQLRMEIGAAGVRYWGYGVPRIVDPASHPRYQPALWNDGGRIQYSTNCYAYACNDPFNHPLEGMPQPGQIGGQQFQKLSQVTESRVRYHVMADDGIREKKRKERLIPLVRLKDDPVPDRVSNVPGYYLIALVTAPGRDYHWLRQDHDGMWSHKPGWGKATDRDTDGRLIFDPREAELWIGNFQYKFTTFYYAPTGGVRTGDLGVQRRAPANALAAGLGVGESLKLL